MSIWKSKKGYFFIIDAIIALFILILGAGLAFSYFTKIPQDTQVGFFSSSTIEFFSKNKLINLNNEYVGSGGILHKNGNITNLDNTVLNQIGEFYYRNTTLNCEFCLNLTTNMIHNLSPNFISKQYSYEIRINNTVIYNISREDINKSEVLYPAKTIIHGLYEEEFWGPYIVEVWTWR